MNIIAHVVFHMCFQAILEDLTVLVVDGPMFHQGSVVGEKKAEILKRLLNIEGTIIFIIWRSKRNSPQKTYQLCSLIKTIFGLLSI